MKDNISPEEKLLKLIKRDNGNSVAKSGNGFRLPFSRNLMLLDERRAIILGFSLSFLFFIYTIVSPYIVFRNVGLSVAQEQAPRGASPQREIKPFESYLEAVRGKDIFKRATIMQGAELPVANLEENMLKDITLIGVISDENPQAILENKKAQKTFYLRKGQMIEDFKVADIKEGKVILEREGQMYELNL